MAGTGLPNPPCLSCGASGMKSGQAVETLPQDRSLHVHLEILRVCTEDTALGDHLACVQG